MFGQRRIGCRVGRGGGNNNSRSGPRRRGRRGGGGAASPDAAPPRMHIAVLPEPRRRRWEGECGMRAPLPSAAAATAAATAAVVVSRRSMMVERGAAREIWLADGIHIEDACYRCMRRAGITHIHGAWRNEPPPKMAVAARGRSSGKRW